MNKHWYIFLAIPLAVVAAIYYGLYADAPAKEASPVIHVGVLPDESIEQLHQRYDPLLVYLAQQTGFKFNLVHASDYRDLLNLFIENKVNLAYLGGLTFLQAAARHDAVPLVMREVDTRFTSYFLVAAENPARQLTEFRNQVFSFGSRLSTSGHLMPRYFLQRNHQIDAEQFFKEVRYSGAHDKTAFHVRDGKVDLGVANAQIIKSMFSDGRLDEQDVRVIWETPPYADYVWVVHDHMRDEHRIRLQDAFLKLDSRDVVENKVLSNIGARVFLPAGVADFQSLKRVAESLDMLPGD